jgi:hypothetical protein
LNREADASLTCDNAAACRLARIDIAHGAWFSDFSLAPEPLFRDFAMTRRMSKTTSKSLAALKGGATQ